MLLASYVCYSYLDLLVFVDDYVLGGCVVLLVICVFLLGLFGFVLCFLYVDLFLVVLVVLRFVWLCCSVGFVYLISVVLGICFGFAGFYCLFCDLMLDVSFAFYFVLRLAAVSFVC